MIRRIDGVGCERRGRLTRERSAWHTVLPTRLAALAGLLAILLQTVLPTVHPPLVSAALAAGYVSAIGAPFGPLCLNDPGLPDGHASPEHGSYHFLPRCPLCLAMQHGGLGPPPRSIALPIPSDGVSAHARTLPSATPLRKTIASIQPRAPPAQA
jgi:hypothetical protein